MFCENCGSKLNDNESICTKCRTAFKTEIPKNKAAATASFSDNNKEWADMTLYEKTESIVVIVIGLFYAFRFFKAFGFSIDSTGLLMSILMFLYCFLFAIYILAIPFEIASRTARWALKIPSRKLSALQEGFTIIVAFIGIVLSYISILKPVAGIVLLIVMSLMGLLQQRIEKKGDKYVL